MSALRHARLSASKYSGSVLLPSRKRMKRRLASSRAGRRFNFGTDRLPGLRLALRATSHNRLVVWNRPVAALKITLGEVRRRCGFECR